MSVYLHDNYKLFVKSTLSERPNKGYGQMGQLAKALGVTATLISQIINGPKHLTVEQADKTAHYLGLSVYEEEFFLTLVMAERAGTLSLQNFFQEKLKTLREQGREWKAQTKHRGFSKEEQAVFYSDWIFSAVRQMVAIPGCHTVDAIGERLNLDRAVVKQAVDFLLEAGLLKTVEQTLVMGPLSTHLDRRSPWVRVHHQNWRAKAIERMSLKRDEDLFFTMPATLGARDFLVIRETLQRCLDSITATVDGSPSEQLACLTIDWFKF